MEVPRPIRCETFVINPEMLPTVADLMRESDPDQIANLYQEAGLVALAGNAGPLRRAAIAAGSYQAVTSEDIGLYTNYLSETIALAACMIPPPQEALSVLVAAQKTKLFDDITVLSCPESGECLVIGSIDIGNVTRYFKIAHWGYSLVKLDDLRTRRRRYAFEALKHRFRIRRPRSSRRSGRSPVYFGAITLLTTLPCWLLLTWVSWWIFAPVLAVVIALGGVYVAKNSSYNSAQRWTVGWLSFANAVIAAVAGCVILTHAATANRTEEVLVCSIEKDAGLSDKWLINTSAGQRELEAGFYNGIYYPLGAEAVAKQLKDNWVRLTVHGIGDGGGFGGPYVTGGKTLRPGACG